MYFRQQEELMQLQRKHQQEVELWKTRQQKIHTGSSRSHRHHPSNKRPQSLPLTSSSNGSSPLQSPSSPNSITKFRHGSSKVSDSDTLGDSWINSSNTNLSKKSRTISEDMMEYVQDLTVKKHPPKPPSKMTLNQMKAQQLAEASGYVSSHNSLPLYSAIPGAGGATYQTSVFHPLHTLPSIALYSMPSTDLAAQTTVSSLPSAALTKSGSSAVPTQQTQKSLQQNEQSQLKSTQHTDKDGSLHSNSGWKEWE